MTPPYTKVIAKGSELVVMYNEKPEPTIEKYTHKGRFDKLTFDVVKISWESNMKECKFFDANEAEKTLQFITKDWPEPIRLHDSLAFGIVVSCISIKDGFAFFEPGEEKEQDSDLWPSDEEIGKTFTTDNFDSGDDDDSEGLNHANELRSEGAKWLRDQLKSKYILTPKK